MSEATNLSAFEPPKTAVPAQPAEDMKQAASTEAEAAALKANLSAIANSTTESLEAMGSAVGLANVTGDANVSMSVAGLISAKHDASVSQSYTSAVLASDTMKVSQAISAGVIARTVTFDQSGAGVVVASDAAVSRGFVGVVLSGRTTVSDDSTVIISTQAALIIAAAIFGVFGLAVLMGFIAVRRARHWAMSKVPNFSNITGHLPDAKQLRANMDRFRDAREQIQQARKQILAARDQWVKAHAA